MDIGAIRMTEETTRGFIARLQAKSNMNSEGLSFIEREYLILSSLNYINATTLFYRSGSKSD